jgi:hypothetical protein
VALTVRTLHATSDVADVGEVDEVDDPVDVRDVDEGAEELVVGPGVVVVGAEAVVGGVVEDVEEAPPVVVDVLNAGATATGFSPTWESARLTICQVSTVVMTTTSTHAEAIFQEIMPRFSQAPPH